MRTFLHALAVGIITTATLQANAQTLSLSFKDGEKTAWDGMSTKEVSKISHSIQDGSGIVQVNMKGGSVHEYNTDSLDNIVSNPVEDLSAYENGDLLEIINQVDEEDTTFITMMCPGSGMYTYFKTIAKLLNTKLRFSKLLPYTLRYHLYDFTYVSTDYDGNKIKLSGRMFYPYSTNSSICGKKLELSKVFLENHYTTLKNLQSPTSSFENQQLAGMCTKGYLVIEPDYLGFGVTKKRSQLFVDQLLSRHVVDCLKAAMQLKEKVNADDSYVSIPLADNAPLLNSGVSQGASVAVGVHRFIENELSEEEKAAIPQLEETRVCAGPYKPFLTVETYAKWDSLYYCATLPMILQGVAVAHSDLMVDDENKAIPVQAFFSDKLNSTRYPQYSGYNVWEMLECKDYDSHDVMNALWSTFGNVETQKASLYAMLNPELVNLKEGTLYYDHPYLKALKRVLDLSDNSDGWCPKAQLSMWHGPNDNIVPYQGSVDMYNNIHGANPDAPISFQEISDEGMGGHTTVCGLWMMAELLGVNVNTVIEILKTLSDLSD